MGVTIKQIADEAGLSWPAVSQILKSRGRFAAETRQRVLAVAAKHDYRPNASARALRQQASKLVGVVFRNAPDQPFTNMAAFEYLLGINQRFQAAEYDTVIVRAGELLEDGAPEPRVFRERLVDGIIAVGAAPKSVIRRLEALSNRVIWLDGPVWNDVCCVRRDEELAGRLATEAMIEAGYRDVVFVTRDAAHSMHHSHFEREAGARGAAAAAGATFHAVAWHEDDDAAELDMVQSLTAGDAGLVVGSLPIARRLVNQAASLGRVPGHHFGVACCDDSMENATAWRNLSRVQFDRYQVGTIAASMMLELLADPSTPPASRRIGNYWLVGNTAAGPRSGGRAERIGGTNHAARVG